MKYLNRRKMARLTNLLARRATTLSVSHSTMLEVVYKFGKSEVWLKSDDSTTIVSVYKGGVIERHYAYAG